MCAGGGRGGSGVEVRRRATTRVSAPYGRPGTAYVSSRTLLPCCGLETRLPPPGRGPSPCVPDGSHGHAVGPWRRAGVAVPHLALISLEAASRSSRRVKTVVSSHRHRYDPRIDSRSMRNDRVCRSHRPTWAAPHGIFNVPPYDRATSRISTSVQYVYRRAPPASARAPAEPQGRPRDPQRAGVTAS